jgi:hypothetical protein
MAALVVWFAADNISVLAAWVEPSSESMSDVSTSVVCT